jgi:hypothetical protein
MEGLLESVGSTVQDAYKPLIFDRYLLPLRNVIGETAFQDALSEGRAMSFTQAVHYALAGGSGDRLPDEARKPHLAE